MAVWQRKPKNGVLVHSDQGSQYASSDYLAFMKAHNLAPSMSRRGNCHDNAVAESFIATFKKKVGKRKIYSTREEAKGEMLNFIEMFYNRIKRHSHTSGVSSAKFEEMYFLKYPLSSKRWGVHPISLGEILKYVDLGSLTCLKNPNVSHLTIGIKLSDL